MKSWLIALCLWATCGWVHGEDIWQPAAGHAQLPLWPGTPPNAKPMPGPETTWTSTKTIAGKTVSGVKNVAQPTLTVYAPTGNGNGTAVVVFPGGGFEILAMDLEGTDVCDWLTAKGVTCILLKYRVPSVPYVWQCNCRPHNRMLSVPALQDAQRALRLVRAHAAEWHIDPHKVGVLGFSAGGYLVAEASTQFKRRVYTPVDATDKESARPDFALAIYPGHLADDKDVLNPNVAPPRDTPPTFVLQAEDDHVDGVNQALVYYDALRKADVPAELHIYAHGGHAFGLRPTAEPIMHWPALAEVWMRGIGMMPTVDRP